MRRRTLIRTAGGIVAASAVIPTGAVATGRPGDFVAPGINRIDIDGDGDEEVGVFRARDPTQQDQNGRRDAVVLISSRGVSSVDYATTIAFVDDVGYAGVTDGGGEIEYEFYEGAANENAAPDEFWMLLEGRGGTRHVLFDTLNLENDRSWERVNPLTEGHLNDPYEWKELNSDGSITSYRASDADVIKRVGVGRGSTRTPRVSEVYYRNLTVDGEDVGLAPASPPR